MAQKIISISTRGQGLYEFTAEAASFVRAGGAAEGLLTVFVRHTSCSLLIQENADPDVRTDLDATRDVLKRQGGLWFWDESYVISRRRDLV